MNSCQVALKEWAVVVDALLRGEHVLLLRKGGIMERRGGFQVEHQSFFLFPTYLHQNRVDLVDELRERLPEAEVVRSMAQAIVLAAFAKVESAQWVDDLSVLQRLDGLHALSASAVEGRFRYGERPGLWAVLLRVYRSRTPLEIPDRPEYAGCRSWVPLAEPLPCELSETVLDDAVFLAMSRQALERLRIDRQSDS